MNVRVLRDAERRTKPQLNILCSGTHKHERFGLLRFHTINTSTTMLRESNVTEAFQEQRLLPMPTGYWLCSLAASFKVQEMQQPEGCFVMSRHRYEPSCYYVNDWVTSKDTVH